MTSYLKTRGHKSFLSRITLIGVLFFVLAVLIIAKLFYLQIIRHRHYENLANQKYGQEEMIEGVRGRIYTLADVKAGDQLYLLAGNQELYLLYGVPAVIKDATSTIAALEKTITLSDEERWQMYLSLIKDDPYEPLRHYLTKEEKDKIEKMKLTGIGLQPENKRIYYEDNLFSHLLGFVGYRGDKRVGQYGIEEYFEKDLAGKGGLVKIERDPLGRLIIFGKNELPAIENGADIVLGLDPTVQFKICSLLEEWVKKMAADDGSVVAVEPQTGRIIALCNKPDFNPNDYQTAPNNQIFLNQAISGAYEPGSVFKSITMSAAVDLEKVTPETTYVDEGFVKFGKDVIHNAKNKIYGKVNMVGVLDNSINTGAVFAAQQIGHDSFKDYVEKFGFGKKTGIMLPVEHPGNLATLNKKGEIYTATASYGQGIMVTPLQLAMAYSAIANGGILMKPLLVVEEKFADGKIKKFEPEEVRRVIETKTANVIKAMLVSVVKNGHSRAADIAGYNIGGKTGTANIPQKGGGYGEETIHTFAGFAPAENPKFVLVIKMTRPKNSVFAEGSVVPAFAEMAKFLLNYYQVKPK